MIRTFAWIATAALLAGLVAGCGEDEEVAISKVFVAPPWTANESYEYVLSRAEDGEEYGTCTLETTLNAQDGLTRLSRLCGDGENRDDGTVLVDPQTLVPHEANRTQVRPDKNSRLSFTAKYEPPIVKFIADENGNPRDTERDLPEADDLSPDPGYYDDESLLWLVRGLELRDGWEGSFQDVSAGTGQTFRVDLKVENQEQVTVPAGEFTAWKVRIRTASITNYAWVEASGDHRLIKARIRGVQDVNYELTSSE